MTTLAVMQPYFFPYLGYFQLVSAVEVFVFLDDVTFIKQGWTNRNVLWYGNTAHYFSIPIRNASSFVAINKTEIHPGETSRWKRRFERTLTQNYSDSPYLDLVLDLFERSLASASPVIADIAVNSVLVCSETLGLQTMFKHSSNEFPMDGNTGVARILKVAEKSNATCYINSIGGKDLYSKEPFASNGIQLKFLSPNSRIITEKGRTVSIQVSILDLLLRFGPEQVRCWIGEYELI